MNLKTTKAIQTFKSGYNCAQAVLSAYTEELNFDENYAFQISSGFGGGMGRLQLTCGAVTGAFMVFGIYNSQKYTDKIEIKNNCYSMIQLFSEKFKSIHNTISCKSLLNIDLNTDQGQQYAKDNKLFETVCEKCIIDSVIIIEEIFKK